MITEGKLKALIRSALRQIWRNTRRKEFLKQIRFPVTNMGRTKFAVKCVQCPKIMGFSQKAFRTLKDGTQSKRMSSVYEVDHVHLNPSLSCIEADLGNYAHSLFNGDLQILCLDCHVFKTYGKE